MRPVAEGKSLPRLSAVAAAEMMAHVLRVTYGEFGRFRLYPAQWMALRYFEQAPASARTVTAFARFSGTTKATASQTVTSLLRKGLLRKRPDVRDRRNVGLEISDDGRKLLDFDPLLTLGAAIAALDGAAQLQLARSLETMLRNLLRQAARRTATPCSGHSTAPNAGSTGTSAPP